MRRMSLLTACLLAAGALGAGLPDDVTAELAKGAKPPAVDYQAVRAWECERPENHQSGHRVDDPDASEGAAWEVLPGTDPSDKAAVFGPYIEVPEGNYVALFRVKLTEPADDDITARVDAVVGYGQKTLASRDLYTGDLEAGKYRQVPLMFQYPGGKLECRVNWNGGAPLRLDKITLYAVSGDVDFRPEMAPQPKSTGLPRELPYRTAPPSYRTLFPHADRPSARLVVVDLRNVPTDLRAALLTLQGLINRRQPSVYAILDATDEQWLRWMQRRSYVSAVDRLDDPLALVTRYKERVKGVILSEARLPASKNIAYMLAAQKDALPASPRVAKQLDLPVLDDLRGRWKTNAEAYQWAFDNLWPQCSHQAIACLWPDDTSGLRDYTVQQRIFTFWLGGRIDGAQPGGSSQADLETMEAIFAKMPTNIPVMGYPWAGVDIGIGEGPGVQSFARYAKYLVGSIGCTNLSVLTGYPVPALHQARPPAPKLEEGKVYVTWVMSDGDNLPVLSRGNFPQLWDDPNRGKVPMAWSMSPSAAQVMPPIVDYYFQSATPNDVFVGAVSGIGYTYPEDYAERFEPVARGKLFDEFLELTAQGMEASDEQAIWIMGISQPRLIRRYAEKIPGLQALFPDYGRRLNRYSEVFYPTARGVPVFHAVTGWAEQDTREQKIARALEQIRSITPPEGNAFLHLFIWNWGADMSLYPEVMEKLGPRYVAVRPDHLTDLARQWMAAKKLLVRAPEKLVAIEGQPAAFRIGLDNALADPLSYGVVVTAGLDHASATPDKGTLAPYQGADLVVRGEPHGDHVVLLFSGTFGRREVTLPLQSIAAAELTAALPPEPLDFVERMSAVPLPHRGGTAQADPDSLDGQAWAAVAGQDQAGHIVFGPYRPTDPGRYLAVFRLRRTGEGDGPFVILDTHVGGTEIDPARLELNVADVPAGGYRCVPLVFDHPGGALETRVFWQGKAGVMVDGILLFRVGR
ncbi:MAG: hypothetical protein HYU66_26275 [Armatimonadetes bacterium]|nr:hypothetical protein [Armatimonadota bacterium]